MKLFALLGTLCVLGLPLASQASTITLLDDHFEGENGADGGSFDASGNLLAWTSGTFDRAMCQSPEKLSCIDFNQTADTQLQSNYFGVLTTGYYVLTVAFAGATAAKNMTVSFGATVASLDISGPMVIQSEHLTFTSTDDVWAVLFNVRPAADEMGSLFLDRVTLTYTNDEQELPAVPLPASAPLLLAGLGIAGALRARKHRG